MLEISLSQVHVQKFIKLCFYLLLLLFAFSFCFCAWKGLLQIPAHIDIDMWSPFHISKLSLIPGQSGYADKKSDLG